MIRLATNQDIDSLLELTRACAKHMINNGIYQWNEHYPNQGAFENDIQRKELFVLEKESTLVGCIVISTWMDDEYKPVSWLTETNRNIYIHRLGVHPNFQGQGHAQRLMDFAEDYASKNAFDSIRLDTFSQNKRNQTFYERRNYKKLETIYYPKQSEHPFYCYELIL